MAQPSDLQRYEPSPLDAPLDGSDATGSGASTEMLLAFWAAIRRRWRIVLVVFLLLAPLGVVGVLFKARPKYTATASFRISPVLEAVVRETDDTRQPPPMFDSFVNTQAQMVMYSNVLNVALQDSRVQSLPWVKSSDALARLRSCLEVKVVPRTYIVAINVTQKEEDAAIRLAQAVLDAYMSVVVSREQAESQKSLETVEELSRSCKARLDDKDREIRSLASRYDATSPENFAVLRENKEAEVAAARKQLAETEFEIIRLRQSIEELDAGRGEAIIAGDLSAARDRLMERHGAVKALQDMRDDLYKQLLRLRAVGLTEESSQVARVRESIRETENRLEEARKQAFEDAEKELAGQREQHIRDARKRLNAELLAKTRYADSLKAMIGQLEAEAKAIGQTDNTIQRLVAEKAQIGKELEDFDNRLKDLREQQRRARRITKASDAEILPDGVKDKRVPLIAVAVVGALFAALALAYLRDRFDPHLQSADRVETRVGLNMLGAVPSLDALRTGQITNDDFVESYRVIRTTLSGLGAGGTPPKSILITSAQAGEGKTSLAASLALSLAEPGNRVLLIDGDIQGPQIGRLLKLKPAYDLRSVLAGERSLEEAVVGSGIRGLDVLVSHRDGTGQATRAVLNARSVGRMLQEAVSRYDHVIVDSPPTMGAADALVWAREVEGVIISSLVGRSDTVAMRLACDRLHSVGARVLGMVVANVSARERYYSYSATSFREGDAEGRVRRAPPFVQLPETPSEKVDSRAEP